MRDRGGGERGGFGLRRTCCHTHSDTSVSRTWTYSDSGGCYNRCTCVYVWVRWGTTGRVRSRGPVYVSRLEPSVLTFSLSLYRHPFIYHSIQGSFPRKDCRFTYQFEYWRVTHHSPHRSIGYRNRNPQSLSESVVRLMHLVTRCHCDILSRTFCESLVCPCMNQLLFIFDYSCTHHTSTQCDIEWPSTRHTWFLVSEQAKSKLHWSHQIAWRQRTKNCKEIDGVT
jgi:hypothetical protein